MTNEQNKELSLEQREELLEVLEARLRKTWIAIMVLNGLK